MNTPKKTKEHPRAQLSIHPPAEMKETTGHVGVVIIRVLLAGLPVPLQTALTALVQVGRHVNAGAILQEGLPGLLQTAQFCHVLQHGLAHCSGREREVSFSQLCGWRSGLCWKNITGGD